MNRPRDDVPCPDAFVDLAVRLADAAAAIIMKHFRSNPEIDVKADKSPVTVADRDAEAAMRSMIDGRFPDHGILGEEYGEQGTDKEYVWVLDPIDGTKSFVTGKPLFGTLIALTRNGLPILGIINMPALDERWIGISGRHTTFNDTPVSVRPCKETGKAWLYATSPHMFEGSDAESFDRLRGEVHHANYGADCYAYGLIANGTVDMVCEASLKAYDFCALVSVVAGAGGIISDWQGRPLNIKSDGRVLAAGDSRTHSAALKILAGI